MNLDNIQITKDCIKEISNIGSTTYVNICNNTRHEVIWGSADWVLGIMVIGIISGLVVSLTVFIYKLAKT